MTSIVPYSERISKGMADFPAIGLQALRRLCQRALCIHLVRTVRMSKPSKRKRTRSKNLPGRGRAAKRGLHPSWSRLRTV